MTEDLLENSGRAAPTNSAVAQGMDAPDASQEPASLALPAIEFQNVTHEYRLGSEKIAALDDVNLRIPTGQFVACMGSSGSGKSTLLNLTSGLMKPTSGHIRLFDREITALPDREMSELRNRTLGYVFQFFNLQPYYTAVENVELPLIFRRTPPKQRIERARTALAEVGLSHRENHNPNELSGGEMQRVSIARALIVEPKILLADEPTGNLDRETGRNVMQLLRNISERRNLTIVMVTHDETTAEYADRILRLDQGHIVE